MVVDGGTSNLFSVDIIVCSILYKEQGHAKSYANTVDDMAPG
jgi:hypothetical protein